MTILALTPREARSRGPHSHSSSAENGSAGLDQARAERGLATLSATLKPCA